MLKKKKKKNKNKKPLIMKIIRNLHQTHKTPFFSTPCQKWFPITLLTNFKILLPKRHADCFNQVLNFSTISHPSFFSLLVVKVHLGSPVGTVFKLDNGILLIPHLRVLAIRIGVVR